MKHIRCDAVIVQVIATEVDDLGRPINEFASEPRKVFRATARDFWADVDQAVAAMGKARTAPAPAPPLAPKAGKRR